MIAAGMETRLTRAGIVMSVCLVVVGCGSSGQQPSDGGPGDVPSGVDGHAETADVPGSDAQDANDASDVADSVDAQDASGPADVADNRDAVVGDAVVGDTVVSDTVVSDTVVGSDASVIGDDVCVTGIAYRSPSQIRAVLPARTGVVVVHADEVVLASRGGAVLKRLPWPREILSAVWSGGRAVILDRGVLTTFDDGLTMVGRLNLVESCVQAVAADAGRIVCGPANDWQRIFYTYDVVTPVLLARSQGITYEGIPMRAVPGRPWFMTQETLFTLSATGEAQERMSFAFGGTGIPALPLTFAGNPATYAVDRAGKVFQLQDTCQPACFASVSTWTSGSALGFIDGPAGSVLLPSVTGAKRYDVMTGALISAGRANTDSFASVTFAVYDPFCGAVSTVTERYSDGPIRSVEQVPYEGYDGGVGP